VSPYQWAVSSGTLPAGLSLSPGGVISGVSTGDASSTVSIEVTDSLGSAPQTASAQLAISVKPADPLVITSSSLPPATVGEEYRSMLELQGGVAPTTWVVQSGSLPPGLVLGSSGMISGQPTQPGATTFTVAASDASTPSAQTVTQSLTLTVDPAGVVSITANLPDGTQGSWYDGFVSAVGGTGPYAWSVQSGSLPPGVTLDDDGSLSGTPTGQGTFNVTLQATDSSPTPDVSLSPQSIVIEPASPVTIENSTLPVATQAQYYAIDLFASGGVAPYSWSLLAGALPSGFVLNSAGLLSGRSSDSGAFNITVLVTDSATPMPYVTSESLTLTVAAAPPPVITTTSLNSGVAGTDYQSYLSASGGVGSYTWSLATGALPAGMTLASYGELYGIPAVSGTFPLTIEVTDRATPAPNVTSAVLTLVIAAPPALVITTTTVPPAFEGNYYDVRVQATGGFSSDTWSLVGGTLPAGMNFTSYGDLYGTPTETGTFALTVQVTDQATPIPDTASVVLSFEVAPPAPLAVSTTTLKSGTTGTYYETALQATGGVGDDSWSLAAGTLPPGMDLDFYGDLYGTPTGFGTFDFTVDVTDSAIPNPDTATASLTLIINAPPPLTVTPTSLDPGSQGDFYDEDFSATGGIGYETWSLASGTLPAGLALDSYGELYGTPTASGTFHFTVQVTDSATPEPDVTSVAMTLIIAAAAPLTITTASLSSAVAGSSYEMYMQASGGAGDDTWSLASGSLPSGISLDPSGDLYGTPTVSGTFPVTIDVTDDATPTPNVASIALSLTVTVPPPLTITSPSLDAGVIGNYYSASLEATGGFGDDTWSVVSGSLPDGLTLGSYGSESDIYGTPTESGIFPITVQVSDSATPTSDVASVTLSLRILDSSAFSILTQSLPLGLQGSYYYSPLDANGGIGPDTWSVISGTLPTGLTLDPSGALYGTPTFSGTFAFTAEVTDSASPTPDVASVPLTLTIGPAAPLTVESTTLHPGTQGALYDSYLEADGGVGPYTWSLASGVLPAGLTLDSSGELTGYATVTGVFGIDVAVTDSASPSPSVSTIVLSLTLAPAGPLTVSSATLPRGVQGAQYDTVLGVTGGIGPYTWSVASGLLPAGLALAPSGYVYGTPSGTGTSSFTVEVSDTTGTVAIGTCSITVSSGLPLQVSTTALPSGTQGAYYVGAFLGSTGGVGSATWSISAGSLPPGITLDSFGELSGSPTSSGQFTFTVEATDNAIPFPDVASRTLALTITPAPQLVVTTDDLVPGNEGAEYLGLLETTGGVGPYTWDVASGSLPAGVSLDPGGFLYGMPTESGTFTFTAEVTDSATPVPNVASAVLTLTLGAPGPLQVTTTTALTGTQGQPFDSVLEATGGIGPYTWSISSGTLPSGLALDASGDISGTPTDAGSSTITVEATDSATPIPNVASGPVTFDVAAASPLQATTTVLTPGTQGNYYFGFLGATGGIGPYTWSVISGTLPAGLTFDPYGFLSGTPLTSGTFSFTAEITDSASPNPDVVSVPLTLVLGPSPALTIVPSSLSPGTQGEFYDSFLQANGGIGPYTWSITSGVLPNGLTLEPTGTVTGYPTVSGSFTFTAEVTDSDAPTPNVASAPVTLVLATGRPLQITTTTLTPGTQGFYYSSPLAATGGLGPYTWSVSPGSLPAGLILDPSGSYEYVDGVPTVSGTFTFTAQVADSASPTPDVVSELLTVTLGPADPLTVESPLPSGTEGAFYDGYLLADGGVSPYTWSVVSGAVPAGLTLNADGELTGYPTAAGSVTFTAEVADSAAPIPNVTSAKVTLNLAAATALEVTTTTLDAGIQGQPYGTSLEADGGIGPYTWSVSAGVLPAGLTLDSEGDLTGIPTRSGSFAFTAEVTDSAIPTPDVVAEPLTLTLDAADPLAISTTTLLPGQQGDYYGFAFPGYPTCFGTALGATGGINPYSWSMTSGSLPAGVMLGPDGSLCGIPAESGSFTFTAAVTDSASPIPNVATKQLTLVIALAPALVITTTSLPDGAEGSAYSETLTSSGGQAPLDWSVTSGSLPPGLSLSTAGTISGLPSAPGTYTFAVGVTDQVPGQTQATPVAVTLIVGNPLLQAPSQVLPTGQVGTPYAGQLAASGGVAPYQWKIVSGELPDGLSLAGSTGLISGIPVTPGRFGLFTVQVSDASSSDPQTIDVQELIAVVTGPLSFAAPTLPDATVDSPYDAALSVTGGIGPYTWAASSGSLPAGLILDADGDVLGTPSAAGTSTITVTCSDSSAPVPETSSEQVTLTVDPLPTLTPVPVIPPEGAVGQLYYQELGATGGVAPYSWTVLSGSLPTGLSLDAYGAISGVAEAAGTSSVTVGVTDSDVVPATATESLTLRISPPTGLSIIVPPLPGATVGDLYPSTTLSYNGGIAPATWSITAGTLPPGLVLDADGGVLSGTPTHAGAYSFTIGVSDSEDPPVVSTDAASITVAPASTGTALDASLTTAIGGEPDTLTATVTSPIYPNGTVEFADNGVAIPSCLTVSLSYQAPFTASCIVSYSVSGLHTIGAVYSGDVSTLGSTAATIGISSVIYPLALAPTSLPGATDGTEFPETSLSASGGVAAYTWSITSGSLPPGLTLDADSGNLSGTPTSTGTYPFTVGATDVEPVPVTATEDLTIVVAPAPTTIDIKDSAAQIVAGQSETYTATVNSAVTPDGTVAFTDNSLPVTTCQDVPVTTSAPFTASCTVPYPAVGTHAVSAAYSGDASTTASSSSSTTISVAPALTIVTTSLPGVAAGSAYPETELSASGGVPPYTWSVISGSLPPGMTLDANSGELSGTPTSVGTYSFTVSVTDAESTPVTVSQALSISVVSSVTSTDVAVSASTIIVGQTETYTSTVESALTPGGTVDFSDNSEPIASCQNLALSASAPFTASCTVGYATPTTHAIAAAYSGDASTAASFSSSTTITVEPVLTIATTSLPVASAGTPYPNTELSAIGGISPYTWSITSGSLPPGLTLDADSGELSGTPTSAGTYPFTVDVTDAEPAPVSVSQDLVLSVGSAQTFGITTTTVPGATEDLEYSSQLTAVGGVAPYSWSIVSGTLPDGLTLDGDGLISGTPNVVGSSVVTVEATDSATPVPSTVSMSLTVTVGADGPAADLAASPASGIAPLTTGLVLTANQLKSDALTYTVDYGDGSTPAAGTLSAPYEPLTLNHTYASVGTFVAQATVVDSVSGLSSSVTTTVGVAAPGSKAPTATLVATPPSGVAPLATSFAIGGTDPGDLPLTYSLDFGDGTSPSAGSLTGTPSVAHTYVSSGNYAATLIVSDGELQSTSVLHVQVDPNTPLVAEAGDNQVVDANDDVHFDGSGSQPASEIQSYSWDFGDQTTGSGVDPDHVYPSPGSNTVTYTVTLTVSNGTASSTSSSTITVNKIVPKTGFTISVTGGGSALQGAEALVVEGNGDRVSGTTDSSGNVTLNGLPDGDYTAYVYQTGYVPATVEGVVVNGVGSASVDLSSGPTADATVTSTRLTYTQVVAAGIDPQDPSNQNVFKFTINLPFDNVAPFSGYVCGDAFCGNTGYQTSGTPPTVTSVGPDTGSSCGGTTVTVSGTNLTGAGRVSFDDQPADFTVNSDSSITATAPGGADGTVDVTVSGPGGTSAITPVDEYTYVGTCPGGGGGGGVSSPYTYCTSYCFTPTVTIVDNEPSIQWLIIPGQAQFLKEFFQVQMLIQNLAPSAFTLTQGSATLQLDSGLSLAPTASPQQQTQAVPDIAGGDSQTISWIVRGDTEGFYNMTADYSGQLQPFGDPVSIEATTATPLHVWGGSAVTMTVDADASASIDYPYNLRVGLTNVSDIPVYNPSVSLYQASGTNYIFQPQQQETYSEAVLQPGETFYTPYYVLIPQVQGNLDLSRAFVQQTGGNVSLASTIVSHPTIDPPATAPTLTTSGAYKSVALTWQTVPGATSYQIFTTPTPETFFGDAPAAVVAAQPGATQRWMVGVDPSTPEWFAISSVINGVGTMEHPLTEGQSLSAADQPTTTLTTSGNGCNRSDVTVTASIADADYGDAPNGPELKSYSYTIGSQSAVSLPVSGGTATEKFVVPSSDIPQSGVSVSVDATDTLGTGPAASVTLGGCAEISSIDGIRDVGNPTIVIHGSGFGTAAQGDPGFQTNGNTHYLQVEDQSKPWTAGGYGSNGQADPCTAIVGYWSATEIIVSPQVNQGFGNSCNITESDSILVRIWPAGQSKGASPIVGTASVVEPDSAHPSVTSVNGRYGPQSGGTFSSPSGKVTVGGENLGSADAVWFGQDVAAPPLSSTSSTITVTPPASFDSGGVDVQAATPGGTSHEMVKCRGKPFSLGCPGDYFYMSSLASWSAGGPFGPISESLGVGSDTGDDAPCQAGVSISASGSVQGDASTSGGIYTSVNSGLPSALLGSGSTSVKSLEFKLSFEDTFTGSCDIPIPALTIPDVGGLYLHVEGSLSGSVEVDVNLSNLALQLNAVGWVNGQIVDQSTLSCKGKVITSSDLSDLLPCVVISPQLAIAGSLKIGLALELNTAAPGIKFKASAGSFLGFGAQYDGSSLEADVCWAPLDLSYELDVGSIKNGGEAVLPSALNLVGSTDACPFGTSSSSVGNVTVSSSSGASVGVTQYASNPAGPTNFLSSGKFVGVQAGNGTGGTGNLDAALRHAGDLLMEAPAPAVTLSDCDLNDGSNLFWWNGETWQFVPGTSVVSGCLQFVASDATSPDLSDLQNALFGIGSGTPVSISTSSLPDGTVGTAYPTTTMVASGGVAPEIWSITSGALPPGLKLDGNTGKFTGTPTVGGTYTFTVGVTDSEPTPVTVTEQLTLIVDPGATSTAIVASSPTVNIGQPETYTATVTAPTAPTAPAGTVDFADDTSPIPTCQNVVLTTSAPYTVACTVSYASAGPHSVTASYSGDSSTTDSTSKAASVKVTAIAPLAITTSSLPDGKVGTAYPTTTMVASGGVTPETWSITSGALPPGLKLAGNTGKFTGTPTVGGTYTFTVGVTDSEPTPVTVTEQLTLIVDPGATSTAIVASSPTVNTGQPETYKATVTAPVAPAGTVDFADGASPIPTCQNVVLTTSAPYTVACTVSYASTGTHSVTASYSGDSSTTDSTSKAASVSVVHGRLTAPKFTSAGHLRVTERQAFTFTVVSTGDPVPRLHRYQFANPIRGTLPVGVHFHHNANGTATISGTPRSIGRYRIKIVARNSVGVTTQEFTLVVQRSHH
jgi:hypothetical protein